MSEPIEPTVPSEPVVVTEAQEATPAVRHFRRTRRVFAPAGPVLHKIPHPPWPTNRGPLPTFLPPGGLGPGVVGRGRGSTSGVKSMLRSMTHLRADPLRGLTRLRPADLRLGNPALPGRRSSEEGGGEVSPFTLRVTSTFSREDGEWRLVHRHAETITSPDTAGPRRSLNN